MEKHLIIWDTGVLYLIMFRLIYPRRISFFIFLYICMYDRISQLVQKLKLIQEIVLILFKVSLGSSESVTQDTICLIKKQNSSRLLKCLGDLSTKTWAFWPKLEKAVADLVTGKPLSMPNCLHNYLKSQEHQKGKNNQSANQLTKFLLSVKIHTKVAS